MVVHIDDASSSELLQISEERELPDELSEQEEDNSKKARSPSPPLFCLTVDELSSSVILEPVSVRVFSGLSVCEPLETPRLHAPPINQERPECEENVWLLGSSFDWLLESLRVQVAEVNQGLRIPAKKILTEQRERCQRFGVQNVRLYNRVVPYMERLSAGLRSQQRFLYRFVRDATKAVQNITNQLSELEPDPAVTESRRHLAAALERLQMCQRTVEHLETERAQAEDKCRLDRAIIKRQSNDLGPDSNLRALREDILQQRIQLKRMADTVECDDYSNPDLFRMVNRCQMRRSDLLLYEAEKEVERLIHDKDSLLFSEDMPDFEDQQVGLQLQDWLFYRGLY